MGIYAVFPDDFLRQRLQALLAPRHQHQIEPVFGKDQRQLPPDARRGPGHQCGALFCVFMAFVHRLNS